MNMLFVFLGSGLGGALRYWMMLWLKKDLALFPLHTFLANILACLFLGAATQYIFMKGNNDFVKYFCMIGVCGGFSTFSTYLMELLHLENQTQLLTALAYALSSIAAGIIALLVGMLIVRSTF